ncbi:MAG TPA: cupin-like domain-containing protein [Steroidobacteraceae bacterium]|nr:cupin-like domain-containing protein [Steroidobacteraceae bacterium]
MTLSPKEIAGRDLSRERFQLEVVEGCQPVIIRGLVAEWPVVEAASGAPARLKDYLAAFDSGGRVEAYLGPPAIAGKYYYSSDLKGFNFERRMMSLLDALTIMVESLDRTEAPSVYVGSVPTSASLPGFAAANSMPLLEQGLSPRIWLGTRSNVSCHHDTFDNLACVIAGRRRFTLFAPELIGKLYVGPIDNTMAGAPVSLAASSDAPEHERKHGPAEGPFPLFEEIRAQALRVELEAGDALYLPKLWWHKVESLAPLNGLVNYWWDAFSAGPDAPYTSMLLAMIAIAERPPAERQAWKAFFDHYVFRTAGHPLAHLPPEQHGLLGPLKPENYARIRARIMHMLRGV